MNNKGQTLVTFVLILPLMVLLLLVIINILLNSYNKNKIDNAVINNVSEYINGKINEEELEKVLKKNLDEKVEIKVTDNNIYVNVINNNKVLINNILKDKEVYYKYCGSLKNLKVYKGGSCDEIS